MIDLKAERVNRGLTLRSAALEMGVEPSTLQRAEAGVSVPRAQAAFRIADFYGHRVTDVWPITDQERAA